MHEVPMLFCVGIIWMKEVKSQQVSVDEEKAQMDSAAQRVMMKWWHKLSDVCI